MITFKQNTTIVIVENFDEISEETDTSTETFKAGEKYDGDIVSQDGNICDIQFADGSLAFGIMRNSFDIISEA